ncbi:ribose operon repressor [Secundilactobacillus kimchicus JCM 15530]|uniref:Ribose operon repressor n=3 Tax=Secundilactobacillus kimchicus TaxID=528209 RepID=A0A0R1HZW1_9LACO|nr:LacI family DNA-binding transcriptional regulator [Secundilactobacillus kimchicus]KRK49524.1 ribose operon repressor [Secundilactobacillus kimchicus JCM 15530]
MTRKVTIRDLAEAAGVSVTTVSQILNGKGDRFSSDTRARVQNLQEQLGYVPDYNARNLIMRSTQTIGVLIPNLANPFFSMFIKGIQKAAQAHQFVPIIFDANHNLELQDLYLEELIKRAANGLIIASATLDANDIDRILTRNGIPYLLFDQNDAQVGDRVWVDDYKGGQMAANYLLQSGHRRIALLIGENPTKNIQQRISGFRSVMRQYQLNLADDMIIETEMTKLGGYQAVDKLLAKAPTAVFTINDEMAVGLYRGLTERGLKIPQNLSIMGYDDIDLAQFVAPKLTTIRQPAFEMGRVATELLIERINDPRLDHQDRQLPLELIERDSVQTISNSPKI